MSPGTSAAALERSSDGSDSRAPFARFAWGVVAYTFFVILFGAVVRITGSGAGCGQHWPTCQGDIALLPKSTATIIEYTHRATSGLSGIFVLVLAILGVRRFPARHLARTASLAALGFMILEAYIGRQLVVLRLVAGDTSVLRAVIMGAHLVNTSLLMGALVIAAWAAAPRASALAPAPRDWAMLATLGTTLVVSVTGALTALGDTLYPLDAARSIAEHVAKDQSAMASFMERGRAIHPLVAFLGATLILVVSRRSSDRVGTPEAARIARWVRTLVLAQVAAGFANIVLSAPGYMQVVHLAIATALWMALVLLYANVRLNPAA